MLDKSIKVQGNMFRWFNLICFFFFLISNLICLSQWSNNKFILVNPTKLDIHVIATYFDIL
jgi:hypothetical protein